LSDNEKDQQGQLSTSIEHVWLDVSPVYQTYVYNPAQQVQRRGEVVEGCRDGLVATQAPVEIAQLEEYDITLEATIL